MGVVLAIPIQLFLMFFPPVKILRAKYSSSKKRVLWALACFVWIPINAVGAYLADKAAQSKTNEDRIRDLLHTSDLEVLMTVANLFWPLLLWIVFWIKYSPKDDRFSKPEQEPEDGAASNRE